MNKTIRYLLCVLFLSSCTLITMFGDSFAQKSRTNQKYKIDDWTGYTTTRLVRHVDVGTEYVYGATSGGIIRYDYYARKWKSPWTIADGLPTNDCYIVAFDESTYYVWCATSEGISCYSPTFEWWENYSCNSQIDEPAIAIGFDDQYVWIRYANGSIWKGNNQGNAFLGEVDNADVNNENITWKGLRENHKGQLPHLFLGGDYLYADGYIEDIHFNRYQISGWYFDKWGKYWVSTLGLGLGRAETGIDQLELMTAGPWINEVDALALDTKNKVMWMGGRGEFLGQSGLSAWDRETDSWQYYEAKYISELRTDAVKAIAVDGNWVWFSTEDGLARFDSRDHSWKLFTTFNGLLDSYVYDVAIDNSSIWVGTDNGLTRLNKATIDSRDSSAEHVMRSALLDIPIYDVELMENLVWLGTQYGVYIYDKNKKVGGFQATVGGPTSEPVYSVAIQKNMAWFGMERGVDVFDVDTKEWLGTPFRLIENVDRVNFLAADDMAVWVATENGVYKFDREREYWVHFTTADGLLDNRVTSVVIEGDYVWFGGPAGITKFYWNSPYRID
ncbi:hypothetical protein JW960_17155 [candidate division KSB1 bacterium]|nr:hypothetical protein [candidate division KSB1 bacterium]